MFIFKQIAMFALFHVKKSSYDLRFELDKRKSRRVTNKQKSASAYTMNCFKFVLMPIKLFYTHWKKLNVTFL